MDRFVRCPHCRMPHDAAERVCPSTGLRINAEVPRSRMSELPPPERRPEPLGFEARGRAPESTRPKQEPASLPETHSLQRELIGQVVGGRYRVLGVLGEGGMGMVYDAEHLGLGRHVAIKVLSPSQAKKRVAVKRFQQEARAAGAIGHPNICEVYDLGQLDDGSPYLVMEKLVGQTLAERISKEGGLPFDEIVEIMIQVAGGLIAAHDKGIVHRDIKPENVFLARRVGCPPIAKILDFGVSKMMPQFQGGEIELDLTRTGMVMGTPYYMSPEQARGERNLDGRVDVYATGVMMYEAIAGKRPYLAPNYNALLLAIINTSPKALSEVRAATPPELVAIVARSMAKNRDDRYPSAAHLLRDLQALPMAQGAGPRLPPPPTAEERRRAVVLGGRATPPTIPPSARNIHGGAAPDSSRGAGATLRSRMAEAKPPEPLSEATRIDVRIKRPAQAAPVEQESIDIPIHVTGSSPAVEVIPDVVEEQPTAIFRADRHGLPPPVQRPPPGHAAPPVHPAHAAPHAHAAPAPQSSTDDWEGETIVKRPAALVGTPRPKPFNPDETVKLDGSVEIDFGDATRIAPPRRPR